MQRKQNATRSGCKCERDAPPDERGGRQDEKMRISAVRKNQCAFSVRFLSSPALSLSLLASASLAAQIPPIPHPFGIAKLVQSSAADVGRIANIECGTGSTGDPLAHFSTGRGGRYCVERGVAACYRSQTPQTLRECETHSQ